MNSEIKSTSDSLLVRVCVCPNSSGELGTERSTSTRSLPMQEATSGTIAQTLPNSGSSTLCTVVSRASSCRDGLMTLPSASGSVYAGSQQHSISCFHVLDNESMITTRMTTSTSPTEHSENRSEVI